MPISLDRPKTGKGGQNKKALFLGFFLLLVGLWGGSFVMYNILPPEHWAQKPLLVTILVMMFVGLVELSVWRKSYRMQLYDKWAKDQEARPGEN